MKGFPGIRGLHPTTKQLLATRALRSVGQGTLVVDFALYLHALQWSAVAIGLLLSASGIFGAALSLLWPASQWYLCHIVVVKLFPQLVSRYRCFSGRGHGHRIAGNDA